MANALHRTCLTVIGLISPLIAIAFAPTLHAEPPAHHKHSIEAVEKCLGATKTAIENGSQKQPQISCDIPFDLKEDEIDSLIAMIGSDDDEPATTLETPGKKAAAVKTIINVRAAKCMAKVRVKTSLVEQAIKMENGVLALPDQWVSCDLTTKSKQLKQVRFAFTPTGKFHKSCLKAFSPKMGQFKLDCTFCRLNLAAQTLRFWVNQIGARMAGGINKALGKKCKS